MNARDELTKLRVAIVEREYPAVFVPKDDMLAIIDLALFGYEVTRARRVGEAVLAVAPGLGSSGYAHLAHRIESGPSIIASRVLRAVSEALRGEP